MFIYGKKIWFNIFIFTNQCWVLVCCSWSSEMTWQQCLSTFIIQVTVVIVKTQFNHSDKSEFSTFIVTFLLDITSQFLYLYFFNKVFILFPQVKKLVFTCTEFSPTFMCHMMALTSSQNATCGWWRSALTELSTSPWETLPPVHSTSSKWHWSLACKWLIYSIFITKSQ